MKKLITTALGMAAIAAALTGAPSALADNSTVDQWNDPDSGISAQGTVRPADMADAHRPSTMAEPQYRNELGAISRSWSKSFCNKAETSYGTIRIAAMHDDQRPGSEHCQDRGR